MTSVLTCGDKSPSTAIYVLDLHNNSNNYIVILRFAMSCGVCEYAIENYVAGSTTGCSTVMQQLFYRTSATIQTGRSLCVHWAEWDLLNGSAGRCMV